MSRSTYQLRRAVDALLAVLLAPACAACGRPLDTPLDGPICPMCWHAVRPFTPPLCAGCGDPLPSRRSPDGPAHCLPCRQRRSVISRGRTLGEYEGALRDIVHAFKYGGRPSIATDLGRLLVPAAEDLLDGVDVVVPVPLHPRRQRARGFNQATELARTLRAPVRTLLHRTRETSPQARLPASRRHANVRGAFGLAWPGLDLSGCRVLLVDDVRTTGATLDACARVLMRAGAPEVRALTVARALATRPHHRDGRPRGPGIRQSSR